MAKKHKPQLPKDASPARTPAGPLDEALRCLRRGDSERAIRLAGQVLASQRGGVTAQSPAAGAARRVLAEAHFRAAATVAQDETRLQHLDLALTFAPDSPKLHFYRALALWQLGRVAEALPELDVVYAREPGRPWLAYLRQLARLATGQPWDPAGLAPVEANTLAAVADLLAGAQLGPGGAPLAGPLLGKGSELWQALAELRRNPAAAPLAALQAATDRNGRKPVNRILQYYRGVAALRAGDPALAGKAWLTARGAGLATPGLQQNLAALLQEQLLGPAQGERWQDVISAARSLPVYAGERSLAEVVGLAHFHLGYEQAQAGRWRQAVEQWRAADALNGSRQLSQNLALAEEALGHWSEAAEAWREMVRRRPRKTDHPDYLSDAQVAAIWDHVADCYQRAGVSDEAITSLRAAARYAPQSVEQRLKLVETLMDDEHPDAAINELQRILELDPQNEAALMRLGILLKDVWGADVMAIWRRVLAVNPANVEAREELAAAYIDEMENAVPVGPPFLVFGERGPARQIEILQAGLRELPGHPKLLLALGTVYAESGKKTEARAVLLEAYEAAPTNVELAGAVMHELLHAGESAEAERLLLQTRQLPGLLPAFWLAQGEMVLDCELGVDWAGRFFEEAIRLSEQPGVNDTRAGILLKALEAAAQAEADSLVEDYAGRLHAEAPKSGALEYLEARRLFFDKHDLKGARKLLRKARELARAAPDAGVLQMVEGVEAALSGQRPGRELLEALLDLES